MDTVRAILVLPADAAPPAVSIAETADAIIALPPAEPADFEAERDRVGELLSLSDRFYIAAPPIDSGDARGYLAVALQPGVYGVVARPPSSIEQLRYLESLLEDLEQRAEIRPGLTAMAVGFGTPRALALMSEALDALRGSADRTTWIAWNPLLVAEALGVPPDSPTVAQSGANVVLSAAAHDLPAVYWFNGAPGDDEIAAARALGFRGMATTDPASLPRLIDAFPSAEAESEESS